MAASTSILPRLISARIRHEHGPACTPHALAYALVSSLQCLPGKDREQAEHTLLGLASWTMLCLRLERGPSTRQRASLKWFSSAFHSGCLLRTCDARPALMHVRQQMT